MATAAGFLVYWPLLQTLFRSLYLVLMVGFEPTLCYNGLQNRSLRPLGHISIILVRKVGVEPTSVPITFGLLRRQGGYLRVILGRAEGLEPSISWFQTK